MCGQPARQLAWCAATQPLPPRQVLGHREPLQFEDPQVFTRWLFRQPRGAIAPSTVLVVGWAETKPCMHVIKAARTGDVAKLRPDKGRPLLPEATPGGSGGVTNVAVAEVIIFAKNEAAHRRAEKWLQEGEYDEHVQVGVVLGEEQLQAALDTATPRVSSDVSGAGPAPSGRGRDIAAAGGARRRWASISSSSARSPSPSDYAWEDYEDAMLTPSKSRRDVASATSSPSVCGPSAPELKLEDLDEPWMMAYTGSPPAVNGEGAARCSARARTPSPDYMWPGFAAGAPAPRVGRDFRPMSAQEACQVRTPSPSYVWQGFSTSKPWARDPSPHAGTPHGKSRHAHPSSGAADAIVGFVLSV